MNYHKTQYSEIERIYSQNLLSNGWYTSGFKWVGNPSTPARISRELWEQRNEMPWRLILLEDDWPELRVTVIREDAGLWIWYYQYQSWFLRLAGRIRLFQQRIILTLVVWDLADTLPCNIPDWSDVKPIAKVLALLLMLEIALLWVWSNAMRS